MSKIKPVTLKSAKEVFKEIKERRRRHPVYYFFHDIYYRIYNFIDDIPLNIRSFIQRGRQGWSSRDTWCFSCYLADTINKGLRHLKQYQHGYPGNLTEGQWVDILNEIIYTFELAKGISDGRIYYISSKEWDEKKYKLLCKITQDINKKYKCNEWVMTKKQSIEYEKGFRLFQKYFFSLWD